MLVQLEVVFGGDDALHSASKGSSVLHTAHENPCEGPCQKMRQQDCLPRPYSLVLKFATIYL